MSIASRGAARLPVAFPAAGPSTGVAMDEGKETEPVAGTGGLSQRMERFCRAYVASCNGALAAREAGYGPAGARRQASRLLRRPDVRDRVRLLRRRLAEDACVDDLVLMVKLETAFQKALEAHQFHAAVRAVEAQDRIARRSAVGLPADGPDGPDTPGDGGPP